MKETIWTWTQPIPKLKTRINTECQRASTPISTSVSICVHLWLINPLSNLRSLQDAPEPAKPETLPSAVSDTNTPPKQYHPAAADISPPRASPAPESSPSDSARTGSGRECASDTSQIAFAIDTA